MNSKLKFYSTDSNELIDFLKSFYDYLIDVPSASYWEKEYLNPIDMADIIAAFIDNKEKFENTNLWVSIDSGVFINIKDTNYNYFIQYLYERYPY